MPGCLCYLLCLVLAGKGVCVLCLLRVWGEPERKCEKRAVRVPELRFRCVLWWAYVLVKRHEALGLADTRSWWSALLLCQSINAFLCALLWLSWPAAPLTLALWQSKGWPKVIWIIYYDAYQFRFTKCTRAEKSVRSDFWFYVCFLHFGFIHIHVSQQITTATRHET